MHLLSYNDLITREQTEKNKRRKLYVFECVGSKGYYDYVVCAFHACIISVTLKLPSFLHELGDFLSQYSGKVLP